VKSSAPCPNCGKNEWNLYWLWGEPIQRRNFLTGEHVLIDHPARDMYMRDCSIDECANCGITISGPIAYYHAKEVKP